MKEIKITKYECELCGEKYNSSAEALKCESRPVKKSGVKVGDTVKILSGDCAGSLAKVEKLGVHSKDWGHYAWERYWHTESVSAKVLDSWGHRQLSFDAFEIVRREMSQREDEKVYCDVCNDCLTDEGTDTHTIVCMAFRANNLDTHSQNRKLAEFIGARKGLDVCYICYMRALGLRSWEEVREK